MVVLRNDYMKISTHIYVLTSAHAPIMTLYRSTKMQEPQTVNTLN